MRDALNNKMSFAPTSLICNYDDEDDDDDSGGLTSTLLGFASSSVLPAILGGNGLSAPSAPYSTDYAAESTTGGNGLLFLVGGIGLAILVYFFWFNRK